MIIRYLIIAALLVASFASKAQPACGIDIAYDANGNRIKRMKRCPYPKTVPGNNSGNSVANGQQSMIGDELISAVTSDFSVYPNPTLAKANVRVDAASLKSRCQLLVKDAAGKILQSLALTATITSVNLSGYADGVYFFILQRGEKVNTVKVVKSEGMRNSN